MTDNPEKPTDELHRLLMELMNMTPATQKTKERNTANLSEQIILLCNEFLSAGLTETPRHTREDIVFALTRVLGSTLAQINETNIADMWGCYDAVCKLLRDDCTFAILALHARRLKASSDKS